ncbi:hypothetical protein CH063_10506 [Colletotrichum higginsianum]|uniref:Uncharacterized protein n=2 Tax=Colletotrichum higginsianum TaxID=80884 RepID=H1VHR2_COLHI|nr:hypothetical protein CH35J_012906 [Colletotrichum higginsianum]TIC90800.1 hypothetical protein CH35J_011527 [Colletotrichum higginsianum]TID04453.1 hypothetical protein CH35J_001729 [Colletotrichum higginsianum]CCF39765.1 hypothetical protein CH063_10506 [Colletotrichum higginsianum]
MSNPPTCRDRPSQLVKPASSDASTSNSSCIHRRPTLNCVVHWITGSTASAHRHPSDPPAAPSPCPPGHNVCPRPHRQQHAYGSNWILARHLRNLSRSSRPHSTPRCLNTSALLAGLPLLHQCM